MTARGKGTPTDHDEMVRLIGKRIEYDHIATKRLARGVPGGPSADWRLIPHASRGLVIDVVSVEPIGLAFLVDDDDGEDLPVPPAHAWLDERRGRTDETSLEAVLAADLRDYCRTPDAHGQRDLCAGVERLLEARMQSTPGWSPYNWFDGVLSSSVRQVGAGEVEIVGAAFVVVENNPGKGTWLVAVQADLVRAPRTSTVRFAGLDGALQYRAGDEMRVVAPDAGDWAHAFDIQLPDLSER